METFRQLALGVHLFALCAWIGGTLALTRVVTAADEASDPISRAALCAMSRRILETVCAPWMSIGLAAGGLRWLFAPFVTGPDRHAVLGAVALLSRPSFCFKLVAAGGLVFMHHALARRLARVADEPARPGSDEPARPGFGEAPPGVEGPPRGPASGPHRAPLRRIQRVVFVLALGAMIAAARARG
jgi:uncharacterized membrane protein